MRGWWSTVDLGSNTAVFLIILSYVACIWWFTEYDKKLRRDYVGIGLYYGTKITVNTLRDVSANNLPVNEFNNRMKRFTDSLRLEVDVDRLDLSF